MYSQPEEREYLISTVRTHLYIRLHYQYYSSFLSPVHLEINIKSVVEPVARKASLSRRRRDRRAVSRRRPFDPIVNHESQLLTTSPTPLSPSIAFHKKQKSMCVIQKTSPEHPVASLECHLALTLSVVPHQSPVIRVSRRHQGVPELCRLCGQCHKRYDAPHPYQDQADWVLGRMEQPITSSSRKRSRRFCPSGIYTDCQPPLTISASHTQKPP